MFRFFIYILGTLQVIACTAPATPQLPQDTLNPDSQPLALPETEPFEPADIGPEIAGADTPAEKKCPDLIAFCEEVVETMNSANCPPSDFSVTLTVGSCLLLAQQCGQSADTTNECLGGLMANPCVLPMQIPACGSFLFDPVCTEPKWCHDPMCLPNWSAHREPPSPTEPLTGGLLRQVDIEAAFADSNIFPFDSPDLEDLSSRIIFDVDGDGYRDILVNRFMYPTKAFLLGPDQQVIDVTTLPEFAALCSFAADLDGDGFLDIFCAYSGKPANPQNMHVILWGAESGLSGETTLISIGQVDAPSLTILGATPWDVDNDGKLDIVLSHFGEDGVNIGRNRIYHNRGARLFAERAKAWGLDTPGKTWAIGWVDFDSDGKSDAYVMNDGLDSDSSSQVFRAEGPGLDGEPVFTPYAPTPPRCDDRDVFGKTSNPMGIALGDLNDDEHFEMYVAISMLDPVLSQQADGRWLNVRHELKLSEPLTTTGKHQVRWSPAFWDLDRDGYLDLLVAGGDNAFHASSTRGQSRMILYRSNGSVQFEDQYAAAGLTSEGHYGPVFRGDLDGDGDLDLLLGGFGQPLRVYRNNIAATGESIRLKLKGTLSNPHGYGASIIAQTKHRRRKYQMGDRWGIQVGDEPILDIAWSKEDPLEKLEISWPSGHTTIVSETFLPGSYQVTEPLLLEIHPAPDVLQPDGKSVVTITARAWDSSGTLRPEAAVVIDAPWHSIDWLGPTETEEPGVFTREFRAPKEPKRIRIEVSVDGVPLKVRPWIIFRLPGIHVPLP